MSEPRQACWTLFFVCFDFKISYRPGTKNVKADALSQLHAPDDSPECPEFIVPSKLIISPIQWSLDDTLASSSEPV